MYSYIYIFIILKLKFNFGNFLFKNNISSKSNHLIPKFSKIKINAHIVMINYNIMTKYSDLDLYIYKI